MIASLTYFDRTECSEITQTKLAEAVTRVRAAGVTEGQRLERALDAFKQARAPKRNMMRRAQQ